MGTTWHQCTWPPTPVSSWRPIICRGGLPLPLSLPSKFWRACGGRVGPPLRRVLGERAPLRLWTYLTCSPQGPAVESGGQGWGDPSRRKREALGRVPAGKDEATSQHTAGAQGPSKVFQLPGKAGLWHPGERKGQVSALGSSSQLCPARPLAPRGQQV